MSIYQTAHYQVDAGAVDAVASAVDRFVDYVRRHEPGTVQYSAWQQADDPTCFVHLFEFADEEAQRRHGLSDAVREFESVYKPVLVGGAVRFTNYHEVAAVRREPSAS